MSIFTGPDLILPLILVLAVFVYFIWQLIRHISYRPSQLYVALVVPSLLTALAVKTLDARYTLPNPNDLIAVRVLIASYVFLFFFGASTEALRKINHYKETRPTYCAGLFLASWLQVILIHASILGFYGVWGFKVFTIKRPLTAVELQQQESVGMIFLIAVLIAILVRAADRYYARSLGVETYEAKRKAEIELQQKNRPLQLQRVGSFLRKIFG